MKSQHLWQTLNYQSFFKKPLSCLVVFCLLVGPILPVYADEISTDIDLSTQNQVMPVDSQNISSVNDKNIVLPNDINLPNPIDPIITPDNPIDTINPIDPNLDPLDNKEPKDNPEINSMDISSNSGSGSMTENPTGKVDGIYGARPKNNLTTGAMIYSYPISVPSGRLGMTPDVDLIYNSQENDNGSAFGYSWGTNIPYIERVNKNGSEKLYNEKYFTSSIDGELIEVSPNTYRPRVDNGNFHTYTFTNNNWEFIDKSGKKYIFGSTANARQDDSLDSLRVYKWMISSQIDSNNNSIKYEYYKDSGQIYPYKINYTGLGSNNGIFDIEFLRESRSDTYTSYKTAFEVTTKYRINEIQAKINGVISRKHFFEYTVGDNGYRSLISSVTSSSKGINGLFTTMPKTKFTYQKTNPGWVEDNTSWTSPVLLGNGHEMAIDIKGDSWVDILKSVDQYGQNLTTGSLKYEKVLYNNSTNKNWVQDNNFTIPTMFLNFEVRGGAYGNVWDQGVRLADINGDQLNDIVQSLKGGSYNGQVRDDIFDSYIYNKTTGWVKDANWKPTILFNHRYAIHDHGAHLVDLNGDSLPDIIRKQGGESMEQINNGSGFDSVTNSWTPPIDELTYPVNRIIDFNSDGLADVIQSNWYNLVTTSNAFLNKGNKTWSSNQTNWQSPILFANSYHTQGVSFMDVNADNLIDIVIDPVNQTGGNRGTYLNTGNGWVYKPVWDLTLPQTSLMSNPVIIADLDADGFVDFMRTQNSTPAVTIAYINKGKNIPDLLSKIEYGSGGYSEIKYKKSAQYKDASGNLLNPNLPINLNTVESITNYDGLNNNSKTSYEYAGGFYYYNGPFDRKLAGFDIVTQINSDGTREISYYHNANDNNISNGEYDDHFSKINKIYRTDFLDSNNNLIKQDTTKWANSNIGSTPANFVYPVQTISRIFTGANSYDTAQSYNSDLTNGNILYKIEYGKVLSMGYQNFNDIDNDKKITEYGYTSCGVGCIGIQLPKQITIKDYTNNKISEKRIYYDNLVFGDVNQGNNTKEENWVTGTKYTNTNKSYNLFGLPISLTDSKSNTTNINYDIYNLYPSSITNPLSQTINYQYDYNSGQVIHSIDANGTIAETDYDGFGRPLSLRSSSDTSYTTLITTATYSYNDSLIGSNLPYVQKTTNYSNTLSGSSYIIHDGLGRAVRNLTSSSTGYIATDTVYDNMGRVYKQSLPYIFTGLPNNYFGPTLDINLLTTTYYDALGRPVSTTNTLGANTNIYNLNTITTIDSENHKKDITRDAYGNIINVTEYDGVNNYTTQYEWSPNNNLTKVVDALGNIRTFTYDSTGNRLTATDFHNPSDTTYGAYSYSYDLNNNLIQKITPNNNTITYLYDNLNRPIRESNNGIAQISYTYDACTNGIGKLCTVTRTGSARQSFVYTNRGLLENESMLLGAKNWSHEYLYDFVGNINKIIYPDNSAVRYTYNSLGQIVSLEMQNSPTSAWQNVISNIVYNIMGQKESVNYANGRTQTYNYNPTKQYQLMRIRVDAPTTAVNPNFIDTNFVWSPSGNLIQKDENFDPANPQKFSYTYDGLSRLTNSTKTINAPLTGYTENYSYNALGNIVNKTGAGSYIYNGTSLGNYANPHAATSIGGIDYSYDKNGNLVSFGTVPNNTDLTYNYRNELTNYKHITPPNPKNITYTYDYASQRIKTSNGTSMVYTPSKYFEEGATINKRYIYVGSQLLATVEKSISGTPNVYYIHPDYLGGTQLVTDTTGNIKNQDLEYYPFGQVLSNIKSGIFDESHKYTGHLYDVDTGLNFMQARYQNGIEGRFWQQDPVIRELDNSKLEIILADPQRWNTYSYASNNPLKYVDPDGEYAKVFFAEKLLSKSISNNPNIPNTIREANFFNNSPVKAINIGLAKDGSTKNISSVSSNFSVNSINSESGYSGTQSNEGTERNAFRHVLWQAMISSRYNVDVAKKAGDSHEYNPFVDLSVRSFNNLYEADQTADLLNNQIGRNIYLNNPGANEVQMAQFSLDSFHYQGLYTVSNSNGLFNIGLSRITNDQYKSSSSIINSLNDKGLSSNKK